MMPFDPLGGVPKEVWDEVERQIEELAKDKPEGWKWSQRYVIDEDGKIAVYEKEKADEDLGQN